MSTVPQDVVNFDPIWPPQVQLNNVPESPVITSQNKMTHNSFDIMDKIPKVNKIQLDNMPRAYEVAKGSKGQVQGYIESPQCQFQFNSMPGIHEFMNWMTLIFPYQLYPHQRGNHTTHVRIHIQSHLATI